MNKDVIYIDVEDDITAITGKVKDAKEKIVALVPPKRTGVLQSVVNLRILQRAATSSGKRLVLITNDQTLLPLAANAKMPVAKNLQSKPEIPEIAALKSDEDDDIIDGAALSVGEHADGAKSAKAKQADKSVDEISAADKRADKPAAASGASKKTPKNRKKNNGENKKVPSFSKFRKRLVLIVLGIAMLIGFLVWAIWYAPKATVEITAKTSSEKIQTSATIGADATTSAVDATIKSVQVQEEQAAEIEFQATGEEEDGEKAEGTITISNCTSRSSIRIPVGTALSYGSNNYLTTKAVTVPGGSSSASFGSCDRPGTVNVTVAAQSIGDEYNVDSGTDFSVAGRSGLDATNKSAITGGSKRTYKIVTQADVQAASEQIAAQGTDEVKSKLEEKLGKGVVAIEGSLRAGEANVTSSPEVGKEATDGKAKLTSSVTYVMDGVATSELESFITQATKQKISDTKDQRVYETGAKDATLADFAATETGGTINLTATAQVGPQVKDEDVKKRTAGKKFGDIQSDLKSIQGVDDVEVKLSPFWVSTVPDDTEKINVKFKLITTSSDDA